MLASAVPKAQQEERQSRASSSNLQINRISCALASATGYGAIESNATGTRCTAKDGLSVSGSGGWTERQRNPSTAVPHLTGRVRRGWVLLTLNPSHKGLPTHIGERHILPYSCGAFFRTHVRQ